MIKLSKIIENEQTSLLIPVIGIQIQGAAYVAIFFGAVLFSALNIPTDSVIFEILIIILIAIPIIGLFGLFVAFRYIIINGSTKKTVMGIIYNLLYLIGNGLLYTIIYFLAKYGVSV